MSARIHSPFLVNSQQKREKKGDKRLHRPIKRPNRRILIRKDWKTVDERDFILMSIVYSWWMSLLLFSQWEVFFRWTEYTLSCPMASPSSAVDQDDPPVSLPTVGLLQKTWTEGRSLSSLPHPPQSLVQPYRPTISVDACKLERDQKGRQGEGRGEKKHGGYEHTVESLINQPRKRRKRWDEWDGRY